MTPYRPVQRATWVDPNFERYDSDRKLIFLYLITNSNTTESGIYPISFITIAKATGLTEEKVKEAFKKGMKNILYDYRNQVVFVVKFYKHNARGNPEKLLHSIKNDFLKTKTRLWKDFAKTYQSVWKDLGKTFGSLFKDFNRNSNSSSYDYSSFKEANNTEFKNKLKETYPEVNIELEFKKMKLWLQENPKKAKGYTNYGRFCGNWISRTSKQIKESQAKDKRPKIPKPAGGYQTGKEPLDV